MRKTRLVVVGSSNTDMVVKAPRIPGPGETVLGGRFVMAAGGKGANQAVAAARLDCQVTLVARLGRDMFGLQTAENLGREGIDTSFLVWDDETPSGVALIMVSAEGENSIAVAPGANGEMTPADVERAARAIAAADVLLLQLEIPLPAVERALDIAQRHGVRVILNPAPAAPVPDDLLHRVDLLTPNEHEAALLSGASAGEPAEVAEALLARGVRMLAMTLGRRGALVATPEGMELLPAFPVQPVDTTGAGDAFNGALACMWGRGRPLRDSVRFANAAAALATTVMGAQPSLPTADRVEAFLAEHKG
ncbi:MAG: ribokinase [Anaerolineae bacterium]|nr:ribokinase [Anaerolineae bacterium]